MPDSSGTPHDPAVDSDEHTLQKSAAQRLRRRLTNQFRDQPAFIVIAQLFLAAGWMRAAAEKVVTIDTFSRYFLHDLVHHLWDVR